MASHQILKTSTKTTTTVGQQQSLETVQVMLHSGLSTIFYLREFFPESVFEDRIYELDQRHHSYQDYLQPSESPNSNSQKSRLEFMRRGKSKRADTLLDILEKGAFPLLNAGVLQQLNLMVVPDRTRPDTVIETYTFTIKYKDTNDGNTLVSLDLGESIFGGQRLPDTEVTLHGFVRELGRLCNRLPRLPDIRFFTLSMTHVHEKGERLPVFGCVPRDPRKRTFFAQVDGWEQYSETIACPGSRYHSSSIRVTYLENPKTMWKIGTGIQRSPAPTTIHPDKDSENLFKSIQHSRSDALVTNDTDSTGVEDNIQVSPRSAHSILPIRMPITLAAKANAALVPTHVQQSTNFQSSDSDSKPVVVPSSNRQSSVSSNAMRMKVQLNKLNQPEQITQGDTQPGMTLRPRRNNKAVTTASCSTDHQDTAIETPDKLNHHVRAILSTSHATSPTINLQGSPSKTPDSSLELPKNLSPYATPFFRTSSRDKRLPSRAEPEVTPFKRRKTRVDAEFILNINGFSSSPPVRASPR